TAFARLGHAVAVVDVPLLFETGHEGDFDRVILTTCSTETQLRRLAARGVTELDARQRIAAQGPAATKTGRAHFVIDTDGTSADTDRQVDAIVGRLGP